MLTRHEIDHLAGIGVCLLLLRLGLRLIILFAASLVLLPGSLVLALSVRYLLFLLFLLLGDDPGSVLAFQSLVIDRCLRERSGRNGFGFGGGPELGNSLSALP
jgi:uncharacterized SAM-binding protein YcdF (DUF218 family)